MAEIKTANFPIPLSLSDEIVELEAFEGAGSSADSEEKPEVNSPSNSKAASKDLSVVNKVISVMLEDVSPQGDRNSLLWYRATRFLVFRHLISSIDAIIVKGRFLCRVPIFFFINEFVTVGFGFDSSLGT
ncbi:hypothetical protein ACFX11_038475 [Malus domestica]